MVADLGSEDPSTYLTDTATVPPVFADVLEANSPGNEGSDVPILLLHAEDAEPIPQLVSDLLFARMCAGTYTVEYRKPAGSAEAANHANEPYVLDWMSDRIAGEPAPTTPCP